MSEVLTPLEQQRCEARLKAYQCYIHSDADMAAAMLDFERLWNKVQEPGKGFVIADTRKFIKRAVNKLESKFTLRTLTPPGPPEKITKKIILEAADIVAAGYMQDVYVYVNNERHHFTEHKFFTSLQQAVLHDTRLAAILEKHRVSVKYMAAKFRKHCLGLHYHNLRMRVVLTVTQMKLRVKYCQDMLAKLDLNPDYLLDMHWMDECTIWIGQDEISKKLHVWSYRHDDEGLSPEPNELFKRSKSFKINLLLVVNARHGCIHAEFLTGTAGLGPLDRATIGMKQVMLERVLMLGSASYKVISSR